MQLRVQTTKSWKGIAWQKVRRKKRRSRRGSAWIIHLPHNQRCLPYLWAKSPNSLARTVLCLLRKAIAVHLTLKRSTLIHTLIPHSPVRAPFYRSRAILCSAMTRVKITSTVTSELSLHIMTIRLNRMYPSSGVRLLIMRLAGLSMWRFMGKPRSHHYFLKTMSNSGNKFPSTLSHWIMLCWLMHRNKVHIEITWQNSRYLSKLSIYTNITNTSHVETKKWTSVKAMSVSTVTTESVPIPPYLKMKWDLKSLCHCWITTYETCHITEGRKTSLIPYYAHILAQSQHITLSFQYL